MQQEAFCCTTPVHSYVSQTELQTVSDSASHVRLRIPMPQLRRAVLCLAAVAFLAVAPAVAGGLEGRDCQQGPLST
jgi:hypothetical protein